MSGKETGRLTAKGGVLAAFIAAGAILVLLGCSTETRSRLMHFFFEYPEPMSTGEPAEQRPDVAPQARLPEQAEEPTIASRHTPFVERQCGSCHEADAGQAPRAEFMVACRICHSPYFQYQRYAHAPVVSSDCQVCHVMHLSPHKALLKASQAILCTDCHAAHADESALTTYHRGIDRWDCTACHDAHFGDSPALLKPEQQRGGAGER